ncbi:MAG: disulfide bond formation protein B [Rickettsiales bacterium]|jgi:disulfide bond formation protein DsbB|nr:disulfide bond formation protein B [Rickettsiales bacterium]
MANRQILITDFIILIIAITANIIALFYQFAFHELPCPLCLLQRVGLFFIAFGAIMNIRHGNEFRYNLIIIISSIYSLIVAMRQVLLHIVPGDPGYGSKFLNLHFYTWNDIVSFLFIILVSLTPIFKNIKFNSMLSYFSISGKFLNKLLFLILLTILLINVISVYLECGFMQCPDNPVEYRKRF